MSRQTFSVPQADSWPEATKSPKPLEWHFCSPVTSGKSAATPEARVRSAPRIRSPPRDARSASCSGRAHPARAVQDALSDHVGRAIRTRRCHDWRADDRSAPPNNAALISSRRTRHPWTFTARTRLFNESLGQYIPRRMLTNALRGLFRPRHLDDLPLADVLVTVHEPDGLNPMRDVLRTRHGAEHAEGVHLLSRKRHLLAVARWLRAIEDSHEIHPHRRFARPSLTEIRIYRRHLLEDLRPLVTGILLQRLPLIFIPDAARAGRSTKEISDLWVGS